MMNAPSRTLLLLLLLALPALGGCSDQIDLENATTPLAFGLDLNEQGQLEIYTSAPAYSRNIHKKSQEASGIARTLRSSRPMQDAQTGGATQGRNYQIILLGKRLLQYEGWFKMLDVIFRDARNTVTDRVIMVDGAVADIIFLEPNDQPLMPILLRNMVTTKSLRSETVNTTAQQLHRQIYETGLTPYISEIKLSQGEVEMRGSALLDEASRYALSLDAQETVLLSILQRKARPGIGLSYALPDEEKQFPFATNTVSFSSGKPKTKINVSYQNGRFHFDIKVKTLVGLTEHLFPYDVFRNRKQLEHKLAVQVQAQMEALIHKFQQAQIDPIGLGLYARAYEYAHYKEVQQHWPQAAAEAKITVDVHIKIASVGPVR